MKLIQELKAKSGSINNQKFFKTKPGEYACQDVFWGVKTLEIKKLAKKYNSIKTNDLIKLLQSKIHEQKLLALYIMIDRFEQGDRKKTFQFYLQNIEHINNWDLVDISAYKIMGNYLFDKPKDILFQLTESKNIWQRRISIISSFYFIKQNHFKTSLQIIKKLLSDQEDLIQKANGWMLREIGKRDFKKEQDFLNKHKYIIPRTTLRYAIEKFPENIRTEYLNTC